MNPSQTELGTLPPNWYMLLHMLCSYLLGFLCYQLPALFGAPVESDFYQSLIQIFYLALVAVIPSLFYFRQESFAGFRKEALEPMRPKRIPLYVMLAVVLWCAGTFLNVLADLLLQPLGILPPEQISPSREPAVMVLGFLSVCVAAPVFEEFFFRGVLVSAFSRYGKIAAILGSSLLFTIAHNSITIFMLPLLYGLVCSSVRLRERSIFPCILIHACCNFISWTLMFFGDSPGLAYIINLTVLSLGVAAVLLLLFRLLFLLLKRRSQLGTGLRNFAGGFFCDKVWIAIFLLYLLNNITTHT